jgi:hypothetical protein
MVNPSHGGAERTKVESSYVMFRRNYYSLRRLEALELNTVLDWQDMLGGVLAWLLHTYVPLH